MSEPMSVVEAFDAGMADAPDPEANAPEMDEVTPDAPTPDDAPAPEPEPVAEASDGRPRDERGRFAPKTDTDTVADEAAVVASEPVKAEPVPFPYRAMGETRAWEGVQYDPQTGNVVVPAEKVGELRAALNAKHLAEGEYVPLIERYKQENTELRQRAEQRTLAESKYEAMSGGLTEALMHEDEATALERFFEWRARMPQTLHEVEVNYYKSLALQGRQPETAAEPAPQHYPMPEPEAALGVTLDKLEYLKLDPAYRDLAPDDWKQLEAQHQRTPFAFIRPATGEEAHAYGVAPGQPVFDEAAYSAYVSEYAESKRARARIATKAQQAAQFNAQVAKKPSAPKPAPTSTPQPSDPPTSARKWGYFSPGQFLSDADE